MAFDIGTLRAFLTLDNSQYKKATDESIQATGKLDAGLINLAAGLSVVKDGYQMARDASMMYVDASNEAYSSVEKFQAMTGTTTEQAGKWHDMLESLGMDLNTMSYAFKAFSNNVEMAASDEGSGPAAAFRKIGVSIRDSNGALKDGNTLMLETLTALGRIKDGTEKNALANDTLGRSYSELSKLIEEGTNTQQRFGDTTTQITERGKKEYKEYTKAVNEFNASLSDVQAEVGTGLYPVLTAFAKGLNSYVLPVIKEVGDRLQYVGYVSAALGYTVSKALKGDFSGVPDSQMSYEAFLQSRYLANASPNIPGESITIGSADFSSGIHYENLVPAISGAGLKTTGGGYTSDQLAGAGVGVATGPNYGNNGTEPAAGMPQLGLGFEYLIDKLSKMEGVSPQVQAYLTNFAQRKAVIEAQHASNNAEIAKMEAAGMQGTTDYDRLVGNRASSGYGDLFGYGEMSQYSGMLQQEFNRLTTGDNAKYDLNGNAIVYVQIDGVAVAEAIFKKLQLLGVKT